MLKYLFCLLCVLSLVAAQDGDRGLERYYPFETGAQDLASGEDGTNNGASITAGVKGNAVYFDGTHDDKIIIPYDVYNNVTYAMWIKQENLDHLDRKIFSFMSTRIKATTTYIEWNADVHQTSAQVPFVLQKNTWYHLAITQEDTAYIVYINGKQVALGTQPPINTANFRNFIGNYDGTKLFGGTIDEVAIWSRALSEREVMDIYTNGIRIDNPDSPTIEPTSAEGIEVQTNITMNVTSGDALGVDANQKNMWRRFLSWLSSLF